MKLRYAAALALVLGALSACSPVVNHTDKQAAMARMTFSPEECEQAGAVYEECSGEHATPDARLGVTESGKTNDTELIRGVCSQDSHYEAGKGCQRNAAPTPNP